MRNPLRRCTVAVAGEFGHLRTHEKIKQWVEKNGGTFSKELTNAVTHLVCSKDHFKRNTSMVQRARRMSKVHIVNFDWLEDSLMTRRPLPEKNFSLDRIVKAATKKKVRERALKKDDIKKGMKQFERGCQEFVETMDAGGYHIHTDYSNYSYDVTLCRTNLLQNKNEVYQLKLYETHTFPKYYACIVKHSAPGGISETNMLAPEGSSFDTAFEVFKLFFRLRTRIAWEDQWEYEPSRASSWVSSAPSMPGSATDRGGSSTDKSGGATDRRGSEGAGGDGMQAQQPWRWVRPKQGDP